MYNGRKQTISTLLSIALLLSATCGLLKQESYLIPEEIQLERIMEIKDLNGKRKRLLPKKLCKSNGI